MMIAALGVSSAGELSQGRLSVDKRAFYPVAARRIPLPQSLRQPASLPGESHVSIDSADAGAVPQWLRFRAEPREQRR